MSTYLFVSLSIYLCIIYLFIYLFIYIRLFNYIFMYLFTYTIIYLVTNLVASSKGNVYYAEYALFYKCKGTQQKWKTVVGRRAVTLFNLSPP